MASVGHVDSLYLDYVFEREGLSAISTDDGFLTYKIAGEECFIANIVVKKEKRRSGAFANLIKRLEAIALTHDCKVITGNIHLNDPGATQTARACLGIGFKINSSGINVLLMAKELKGVS